MTVTMTDCQSEFDCESDCARGRLAGHSPAGGRAADVARAVPA